MSYNPTDLEVISEVFIHCSNCHIEPSIYNVDEDEAQEIFFKEGWRITKNGNQYCPNCAKKKLKNHE